MVLDSLENIERYVSILPEIKTIELFLTENNINELPEGKIEIDGESIFAISSINTGKTKEEAKLEAHNLYADIQICLSDCETYGWKSRKNCKNPIGEFDDKKDIVFYNDAPTSYVSVGKLEFVLFMPSDAHAPLISDTSIKKLIFKVKVGNAKM